MRMFAFALAQCLLCALCFTSRLENEDDWALTSCPIGYFEPISDMLRVDPKYL